MFGSVLRKGETVHPKLGERYLILSSGPVIKKFCIAGLKCCNYGHLDHAQIIACVFLPPVFNQLTVKCFGVCVCDLLLLIQTTQSSKPVFQLYFLMVLSATSFSSCVSEDCTVF